MFFWWVNQNQTLRAEIEGGFIWSPKRNKNGAFNRFYENMKLVEPGDLILSFADQRIGYVGLATDRAVTNAKPDFGGRGENWDQEGWLVPVRWTKLEAPVQPKALIDQLRPTLPTKYAPLTKEGNGLQSVYLATIPEAMACRFCAGKQGDRSGSEDSFVRDRKRAGPPVRRSSRSSNQEQHHNRYHREAGACFSTPWPRQISSKPRTNRRLLPSHRRKGSAIPSSEPHQAVAALRNQSRTSGRLQRSSIDPNVRPPFR